MPHKISYMTWDNSSNDVNDSSQHDEVKSPLAGQE